MMAAFNADRDHVLDEDVRAAIEELQWVDFAARVANTRALRPDGSSTGRYDTPGRADGPTLYVGPSDAHHGETMPDVPLARIIVASEGRTVGELALHAGRTVVGRTPDNDLQIDNRFVSRHHCQILTSPDGCVIEDLNSTNGIVVKAKRVRHHNLNDGDVVTIGTHDLIYVDERAQRAAAPAHTETQKL